MNEMDSSWEKSKAEESSSIPATPDQESAPPEKMNRRRSPQHLWLISYADFMTILMIFFIAMYGYSFLAQDKIRTEPTHSSEEAFAAAIEQMRGHVGGTMKVVTGKDRVIVKLDDRILFGSGSADVNPESVGTLEELANSIKLMEGDVIVEGHTDNIPVKAGRFKSNWELSAARAFSVIQELTRAGIPSSRLAAWGFGENRPLADNTTADGRAKNRRIEIVIFRKNS